MLNGEDTVTELSSNFLSNLPVCFRSQWVVNDRLQSNWAYLFLRVILQQNSLRVILKPPYIENIYEYTR